MLADIRHDVDGVIDRSPGRQLYIINSSEGTLFAEDMPSPLELVRRDGRIVVPPSSGNPDVRQALANQQPGSWLLLD